MRYDIGKAQEKILTYQNDFTAENCMDTVTVVYGAMEAKDGALRTVKTGGHSTALLKIPTKQSFVFEADFVNHQGGGGIFFGGTVGRIVQSTEEEDKTNGYYAFISQDGLGGALGCTSPVSKWNGNITASRNGDRFAIGQDLHLYLRVNGDYIIYTISDCESARSCTAPNTERATAAMTARRLNRARLHCASTMTAARAALPI